MFLDSIVKGEGGHVSLNYINVGVVHLKGGDRALLFPKQPTYAMHVLVNTKAMSTPVAALYLHQTKTNVWRLKAKSKAKLNIVKDPSLSSLRVPRHADGSTSISKWPTLVFSAMSLH